MAKYKKPPKDMSESPPLQTVLDAKQFHKNRDREQDTYTVQRFKRTLENNLRVNKTPIHYGLLSNRLKRAFTSDEIGDNNYIMETEKKASYFIYLDSVYVKSNLYDTKLTYSKKGNDLIIYWNSKRNQARLKNFYKNKPDLYFVALGTNVSLDFCNGIPLLQAKPIRKKRIGFSKQKDYFVKFAERSEYWLNFSKIADKVKCIYSKRDKRNLIILHKKNGTKKIYKLIIKHFRYLDTKIHIKLNDKIHTIEAKKIGEKGIFIK